MTEPYFNTPETVARLTAEAHAWLGTPWCENSSARGPRGGVACHNLPRAIYVDCEFLPKTFPQLVGTPNGSRFTTTSVMEEFLDQRPEFLKLKDTDLSRLVRPGDLIGIKVGPCVNHLGVALDDGTFIHVLMRTKTALDYYRVPPWGQRIGAVWRPVR